MKKIIFGFCIFLLIGLPGFTSAQERPFASEIEAFRKQDSIQFPPSNATLFVGSSSFRLWKDLKEAFPAHQVINRGFGGSSLPHLIQYANEIIIPYRPKQVLIYCGENDFTVAGGISGEEVFERFRTLHTLIRKALPDTWISYVSIKPSPSRVQFRAGIEKANNLIQNYLKKQKRSDYIDIYNPMLNAAKEPREELFVSDRLHMNAQGYAIWRETILPYLK